VVWCTSSSGWVDEIDEVVPTLRAGSSFDDLIGGRSGTLGAVTTTSALLSFAVVAGLLVMVPGLDTALVLRSALTRGRAAAFATATGIGTGSLAWGAASAAGVSALLVASERAFTVLRAVGAAYLVWTGVRLLFRTASPAAAPVAGDLPTCTSAGRSPLVRAWWRGLLTNLLNPKIGVFYVVMIPQFLPSGSPHLLMGLLLAAVHVVEGTVWFAAVILLASTFRRWLTGDRARRVVDRLTGAALVGFGVRLVAP
jgi:threonine/homoserine/homoserine lactone efflux protein